ARTRISTSPGRGTGSGPSRTSRISGGPALGIQTERMAAASPRHVRLSIDGVCSGACVSLRPRAMDVAGKVALVTGGARIGQAVAQALAQRGCALALTYPASRPAADARAAPRRH